MASTVEGELSVAKLLVKSSKRALLSDFVAMHPAQSVPQSTVATRIALYFYTFHGFKRDAKLPECSRLNNLILSFCNLIVT